jgi:peptidoglycan/LPS O-acetylase OafA/YrhL
VQTVDAAAVNGSRPAARFPALDGYRGLAVLAVVLFHADLVKGGWLGVDFFFVLSGFLITRVLVREKVTGGGINLVNFWQRRARRLLPALVPFFVGVALYSAWYPDPHLLPANLTAQALATLAYVANWLQLFDAAGYWDRFTVESPLKHMWSLSIEEQFYLLFPIALAGLFLAFRRRMQVAWILGALTLCSWALGVLRLAGGASFERVYLGTDTRVGAILCGATVGYLSCNPGLSDRLAAAAGRARFPAFVIVVTAMAFTDGTTAWSGRRWLLLPLFELAAAALLVHATSPADRPDRINRLITFRPLIWLGAISYGLYLWHFPILLAAERYLRTSPRPFVVVLAIGASLAVAQLSLIAVERPILQRGLGSHRRALGITAVVVVALSIISIHRSTEPAREHRSDPGLSSVGFSSPPVEMDSSTQTTRGANDAGASGTPDEVIVPKAIETSLPLARPYDRDPRVLLLGDSLAFDLIPTFVETTKALGVQGSLSSSIGCGVGGMDIQEDADDPLPAMCERWIRSFPSLVDQAQPDVVVLLRAGYRRTAPESGRPRDLCSREHLTWYRNTLGEEIRALSGTGAVVAVTTIPYNRFADIRNEEDDQLVDCLNSAARDAVSQADGAVVLPVNEWVCPSKDQCRFEVDGEVLRPDGLHFQKTGAVVAARWIIEQLFGP